LDGYLYFSEGDFTSLDLASDEINVSAGLDRLVIEFDTFFGGTWSNHNIITLEDGTVMWFLEEVLIVMDMAMPKEAVNRTMGY